MRISHILPSLRRLASRSHSNRAIVPYAINVSHRSCRPHWQLGFSIGYSWIRCPPQVRLFANCEQVQKGQDYTNEAKHSDCKSITEGPGEDVSYVANDTQIRMLPCHGQDDETQQQRTYVVKKAELRHLVDTYSYQSWPTTDVTRRCELGDRDVRSPTTNWTEARQERHSNIYDAGSNSQIVSSIREELANLNTRDDELVRLFLQLPRPRYLSLQPAVLDELLYHLAIVEQRSPIATERFFVLFNDLKTDPGVLNLHHWNNAIYLTGRRNIKVTSHDLQQALGLWREMEDQAGILANHITFNILFDVATKARKYVLADMIAEEMKLRGQDFSRFFLTSNMLNWGQRADGEGVRRAYQQLIDAEEVIDTSVINCVIAALLKCGEASAAEMTFERIKQLHASKTDSPLPSADWREKRTTARRLSQEGISRRRARVQLDGPFTPNTNLTVSSTMHRPGLIPDSSNTTENSSTDCNIANTALDVSSSETITTTSIAPDLTTFKLLIRYTAIHLADIDRVAALIDEMEQYSVALDGSIFLYLFKAFHVHGGVLYSDWSIQRLEDTFRSFLKAVEADVEDGVGKIYISPSMCIIISKAYLKCCGAGRCAEIWLEMKDRLPERYMQESDQTESDIRAQMGRHEDFFLEILERKSRERAAKITSIKPQRSELDLELEDMEREFSQW